MVWINVVWTWEARVGLEYPYNQWFELFIGCSYIACYDEERNVCQCVYAFTCNVRLPSLVLVGMSLTRGGQMPMV